MSINNSLSLTIGQRIKAVRQNNQLTQLQFSEKVSASRPYISLVECNNEQPSEMLLKLISYTFSISLEWLKTGEEPPEEIHIPVCSSETIGDRIRAVRDRFHYTQPMLASFITNCSIFVQEKDISRFETGKEEPSEIFLILLSYMFKVSIEWLKTGHEKEDNQT